MTRLLSSGTADPERLLLFSALFNPVTAPALVVSVSGQAVSIHIPECPSSFEHFSTHGIFT